MSLWTGFLRILHPKDVEELHEFAHVIVRALSYFPGALRLLGGGRKRFVSPIRVGDLEFANPVGLAAGFDKNADWLDLLPSFGFGFAEIGTVTPRPQGGNPRPRLFRVTSERTLRNQMGFNNLGAEIVSGKLARLRARGRIPPDFRVGVNVGKNKSTPDVQAADDYVRALSQFRDLVDFAVLNVSSPNTPGLRALQEPEALANIISHCRQELSTWKIPCPLWVKLAPEFCRDLAHDPGGLRKFIMQIANAGAQGWVLTNTLATDRGGLSGQPLSEISRQALASFRVQTDLPILSVGGILDAAEAQTRLDLGAQLVEIYAGWVFGGPRFISRVVRTLKNKKP